MDKKINSKKSFDKHNKEIKMFIKKLKNTKKNELLTLEKLKKSIVKNIDFEIKSLYIKKDFLNEVLKKKHHLKKFKISFFKKFITGNFIITFKYLISAPFIYSMIIPAIILHIFLEIYHQICFRLYDIPRVNMNEYFIFDRKKLPYLNLYEKFNCFYCSYFNCLIAYTKEIAGRTERFWCPIKHSKNISNPHLEYFKFIEYDNGEKLRKEWENLRKFDEYK